MNIEDRRQAVAEEARRHLGRPYVYGAKFHDAPHEFDCSSLVQYVYLIAIGIGLPRVSIDQAREGRLVRPPYEGRLEIGDLIFIRGRTGRYDRHYPQGIGHVFIVTGPNEVVHARSRGDGGQVVRQRLTTVLKRDDITVVRRII